MGAIVRNVYHRNGRWKFRKAIPAKLRPHMDGQPREFIRSLGPGGNPPPPEVISQYAKVNAECDAAISLAAKREAGAFDELGAELVATIVASELHHKLHEDDEDRFDGNAEATFDKVAEQLQEAGGGYANKNPDRLWLKRQESTEAALDRWRYEYARGSLSPYLADELQDICAARGLRVDSGGIGFRRLGRAYLAMLIDVAEATLKRQQGEVVGTPEPPVERPAVPLVRNQTITGLVDLWWIDAKAAGRSQSTYKANERAMRYLSEFLEHDDANAVTVEDIIRFKEKRIADGRNAKTVGHSDIASLRAVFGWAKRNRKTAINPAEDIQVLIPKRKRTRGPGFTADEALAILNHAGSHVRRAAEGRKMALAKRWVPWLCAYTGARVGEIAQLRKQDVVDEHGRAIIVITPEAGTTKSGGYRKVPIHPHLIELGFIQLVEASAPGPLFLAPTKPGQEGIFGATRTVKNRLAEFVREVVSDPRVQPNHGWRHRFETIARNLGFREDVTNWITDHATKGVAAEYGETELQAMALVIDGLPRYTAVMK